jgi:hypothetical protein
VSTKHIGHEGLITALKNARTTIHAMPHVDAGSVDEVTRRAAQLAELDAAIASLTRPNPDDDGFFWWLIAVGISENNVADGVDFTDVMVHDMLTRRFSCAYGREIKAKVLGRPDNAAVAAAQGYTVDEYLKMRGQ